MKHSYHWLAIMVFCAGTANPVHAAIEYAEVTGGRVQGEVHDGLASFKGLSFASPPVGALRWRVPQPVVARSGVRKVDTFAPACMQPWPDDLNLIRPSEDCLYLNVWTAAATAKERRPVMVWIHGGGLTNGMSWETLSHGTKLAPEGVVLVTIAYRLGAFGFLAHSELTRESGHASGNYGLFDAVAALKWVQANIAQFGGDPSRVTIFGGSSGAPTKTRNRQWCSMTPPARDDFRISTDSSCWMSFSGALPRQLENAARKSGRQMSSGALEPVKNGLHGTHPIDIRVRRVVPAALTLDQSKSPPGKLIAGTGTAQVYHRRQHLLVLQCRGADSVALQDVGDTAVQIG
jgi:hypothetical protein